jgi:FMN reductase
MTTRTIAVVSAGLSQPSSTRLLADQLANATRAELAGRGIDVRVEFVDLRDHAHQVIDHLLTGFAPSGLRSAIDTVAGADGLIAVTPIFNASFSGLFKSFFDVLDQGLLEDKPVLIAATGGTARHSLALEHALRPMFAYLHASVVGTAVFAATDDWAADEGRDGAGGLRRRINRAARELADEVERRESTAVVDPFELTTDFESLFAAGE